MARTYTDREFVTAADGAKMAMLVCELHAEREISKALADALEKTKFAAFALIRAIDRRVPSATVAKMMADIGKQYDGFGVQAREALALYREPKQ